MRATWTLLLNSRNPDDPEDGAGTNFQVFLSGAVALMQVDPPFL